MSDCWLLKFDTFMELFSLCKSLLHFLISELSYKWENKTDQKVQYF
jgi:hypothetical protein